MTTVMFWVWYLKARVNAKSVKWADANSLCTDSDKVSAYDLKLMDIDSEHLGIPETTYEAVVQMPSNKFQEIVRDLSTLSDSSKKWKKKEQERDWSICPIVTIECTKDEIRFSADGEIAKGSIAVKTSSSIDNEEDSTTIELQQSVSMSFAVKYLVNFTKATPLSSRVGLNLSADVPLLVDYKLDNVGYVRYYLAPKIGDEE